MTCRIGLLDSGIDASLKLPVIAGKAFELGPSDEVLSAEAGPDLSGHGTALAQIIAAGPEVDLLNAQVFSDEGPTSAAVVAAGLDWLVSVGANLVCMSFGLPRDRDVLREACDCAREAGVIMLGASPARGAPVFPSSYEGVIRITGDARCGPGAFSALHSAQADFGACPEPGGASFAVAYAVGELGRWWPETNTDIGNACVEDAIAHLEAISSHHGPERKS